MSPQTKPSYPSQIGKIEHEVLKILNKNYIKENIGNVICLFRTDVSDPIAYIIEENDLNLNFKNFPQSAKKIPTLEINLSIIAAVLTIVGYSMNDTVVIYDRIRENLNKHTQLNISETANLSINETLSRTIITSVTTLLALFSIYILGGEILRGFSFAMILGVLIGTYSSIFVAAPVLKFFKVSYKTLEKKEEKIVP